MSGPEKITDPGRRILEWLGAFLLLALFAFLTRWGSLSHDVIDWDESTMILLGSDVADGILPFLGYWDNKPPMIFLTLGAAFSVFGETLAVARGVGALAMTMAAFAVYGISRRRYGVAPSLVAGSALLAAAASWPMQTIMSEHLAIAFLMPGLWLVIAGCQNARVTFLAGILIGLAVLTRTNLAVPALAVSGVLLWAGIAERSRHRFLCWVTLGLGGLLPLALIVAVYVAQGHWAILFETVVLVPFAYAAGQTSAPVLFFVVIGGWFNMGLHYPATWGLFVALCLLGAGRIALAGRRDVGRWYDRDGPLLAVAGGATLIGVAINGGFNWHHLLQIAPFTALWTAGAVVRGGKPRLAGLGLAGVFFAATMATTLPATVAILRDGQPVGRAEQLAAWIQADAAEGDQVFALWDNLVYWYLDMAPPTPVATHPSSLVRPSIRPGLEASGLMIQDEFLAILAGRPKYLITREPLMFYLVDLPEGQVLLDVLASSYEPWHEVGGSVIYRRL